VESLPENFPNLFLQKPLDKQSPPDNFHFIGRTTHPTKTKNQKRKTKHMSHKIEKPHDMVLSTEGTEWHKLATHLPAIGDMEVELMLFDIVESPAFVTIDGMQTALEDYKVLVADHRKCRSDLSGSDALVPLHIPKSGYRVISNREIWNVMKQSLAGSGLQSYLGLHLGTGKEVRHILRYRQLRSGHQQGQIQSKLELCHFA
jgi:hypothetical protein